MLHLHRESGVNLLLAYKMLPQALFIVETRGKEKAIFSHLRGGKTAAAAETLEAKQ